MSQLSNVESLLTAIAKGDSSYLVEPQSRVEALLYEIYLNGGGGTGDITRAEVLRLLEDKVDKLVGYGLISDEEAERLKNVDNYDDSEVRGLITDISNSIIDLKTTINGTADGQFIYDTEAKMTKVVPDGVNKGIVSMVGGKTEKGRNLFDITNVKTLINSEVDNNATTNIKADTRNTAKIRVVAGSTMLLSDQLLSKPDHYIFTFTSTIVSSELTIKNSGSQIDTGITVNMETPIVKDHIYTVSFDAIAVNPSIVNGLVLSNIQVEEGSIASAYEPYHEDLWNAPVEKVILSDNEIKSVTNQYIDNGVIADSPTRIITNVIAVKPNDVLTVKNLNGKQISFAIYDASEKFLSMTIWAESTEYTVPSDIHFIRVLLRYSDNTDISVTDVKDVGVYSNLNKTTLSLESIVDKLPDYGCSAGDVYNYVDFEEMVYHHKVASVDLGTLNYQWVEQYNAITTTLNTFPNYENLGSSNIICDKYEPLLDIVSEWYKYDKVISVSARAWSSTRKVLAIKDSNITESDVVGGKVSKLNGVILNYELAEEELIDISDFLLPFMFESGGTITFENEHYLDVPNTVIYEKEMI